MLGLPTPRELRPAAATAAALLAHPTGPPVPAWLIPLFDDVGARHDLAPELLAAIAATFSGYNPESPCGLMGFPSDDATVSVASLVELDPAAYMQLRSHVEDAVAWLARESTADDGLSGALERYAAVYGTVVEDGRNGASIVAEIVGRFAQLVGRVLARSTLGRLLSGS